jgi:hypothetical protein
MKARILTVPSLCRGQAVKFIGGTGIVKNYRQESGTWSYLVEMELGSEPDMGRVGYETMIWLPEPDLFLLESRCQKELAIA